MNDIHFPYGKIAVVFLLSLALLAALVFLISVLNMQVGEVEVGRIQAAYGTGGEDPTPLPTPWSIFQTEDLDIYYTPPNDIDALPEGNDYYVYIQQVPENSAYQVYRRVVSSTWTQIAPTMEYEGNEIQGYYFHEPDTLDPDQYYYKVSSPGALPEDELSDEETSPTQVWQGGIALITPTPIPTNTPTPKTLWRVIDAAQTVAAKINAGGDLYVDGQIHQWADMASLSGTPLWSVADSRDEKVAAVYYNTTSTQYDLSIRGKLRTDLVNPIVPNYRNHQADGAQVAALEKGGLNDGDLVLKGTVIGGQLAPTPSPLSTPQSIWQAESVEADPTYDVDHVDEGNAYVVHWGSSLPNEHYTIYRKQGEDGSYEKITPTPAFESSGGYFHFGESSSMEPDYYSYLIASRGELDPASDEGSEPPTSNGGIYVNKTIYVASDATGNGDGTSWEDAYTLINHALDVALNGDEVWVKGGTYYERITMVEGVGIYGGFVGDATEELEDRDWVANPTVLDASYFTGHLVEGVDDAVLDGFTLTGAEATVPVNLQPEECEPTVYCGGGVFCDGTSPTIQHCWIVANEADSVGGGVYCCNNATPTFKECVIMGNDALSGSGAGVFLDESDATFLHCTITGNQSQEGGDGVYSVNSSSNITNCILWDNGEEVVVDGTATPTVSHSCVQGGYAGGDDNFSDDPLFLRLWDGENADLRMRSGTPCENAGVTVSSTTDLMNIARTGTADVGHLNLDSCSIVDTVFVDYFLTTGLDDGSTWENAFRGTGGLQNAIDAGADAIWVKETPSVMSHFAPISVDQASCLEFYGGFADSLTGIDGTIDNRPEAAISHIAVTFGGTGSVIRIADSSKVVFDAFHVSGGKATDTGEEDGGGHLLH